MGSSPKKQYEKSNPIWTTFKSMPKNCSLYRSVLPWVTGGIREGDGLRVLRCWSTCLYSFKQLVMSAISMRLSHPCHSTTTCFPLGFLNNLFGVDLLTPMAHLVETYLLIITWSILIVCVKMQLVTYRCQQNTESHCNNGQSCLINIRCIIPLWQWKWHWS